MIEKPEIVRKYLIYIVYTFLFLTFCIMLLYYYYPTYYNFIKNIIEDWFFFFIEVKDALISMLVQSSNDYAGVWNIAGLLLLIFGLGSIVLSKLGI